MLKQYRVYINLIKGEGGSKLFSTKEQAVAYAESLEQEPKYVKEVKNVFVTEEWFSEENGEMLLEDDIYCKRNEVWYNSCKV